MTIPVPPPPPPPELPPNIDWARVITTLPANAYRPSYFYEPWLQGGPEYFSVLLRQLDPAKARELRDRPAVEHYREVLEYCYRTFPCNEYWADDLDDGDLISEIPVWSMGLDPWEETIDSPPFALCIVAGRVRKEPEQMVGGMVIPPVYFGAMDFECLKPHAQRLPAALGARRVKVEAIKPPRGRTWRKPWQGLRGMYLWATAQTHTCFLDVAITQWGEVYALPNFNIEEIRSLTEQWKIAKPIRDSASALAEWVEAQAAERVPMLANALLGDPATLDRITKPK